MKHAITLIVAVLLVGGLSSCADRNIGPSVDDLIMMNAFGIQSPQQVTADRVQALEYKIQQLEARQ